MLPPSVRSEDDRQLMLSLALSCSLALLDAPRGMRPPRTVVRMPLRALMCAEGNVQQRHEEALEVIIIKGHQDDELVIHRDLA